MTGSVRLLARAALAGASLLLPIANAGADKLDDIRARGRLLVGATATSPPFSFRQGDRIVGYDLDLAAAVAARLGVTMEIVSIINAQRLPALEEDRVDLVAAGMTRSAGRARDIDFSLAYFDSPHKVLVRRDSGLAAVGELAGKRLALVKSASVDAELKAAVPTMEIVFVDDYQMAFDALRERRVEGFLADELLLLAFAQRSGAPQDYALLAGYELPRTAGFGVKKNEPRLMDAANATLLSLEASGEAARIFDRWFAPLRRPFRIQAE